MTAAVASLPEIYARDGFVFPIEVVDSFEASSIQNDLEKNVVKYNFQNSPKFNRLEAGEN